MPVAAWFAEILERELRPWVTLSGNQIEQLFQHYELLDHWNKRINLTSIGPGPELVIRHYGESLFFADHLPSTAMSIADVGSGAGFPGVPIAVLEPAWKVTLIESNQRKAVFLREAARKLSNVDVMSRRAEEVSATFDWLVSRAVDPVKVSALVPLLAPRIGLMVSEDDLPAIKALKHVAWSEPIRLPWGDRRVCVYGHCFT